MLRSKALRFAAAKLLLIYQITKYLADFMQHSLILELSVVFESTHLTHKRGGSREQPLTVEFVIQQRQQLITHIQMVRVKPFYFINLRFLHFLVYTTKSQRLPQPLETQNKSIILLFFAFLAVIFL